MKTQAQRSAFFLGVGGIGMSALAQWLQAEGWEVTGSDRVASDITELLARSGINVQISEEVLLPEGLGRLVYSDAVPGAHRTRVSARQQGIREQSYAELLGELTSGKRVLAVAGSHGKSTTTALVGLLLEAVGKDPTVVVGTRVPQWERGGENEERGTKNGSHGTAVGNFRRGRSDLAVVEADEYRNHFLHLSPTVAVVTSVDYDHVDVFASLDAYLEAFRAFVGRVLPGGTVVLRADDPHREALQQATPSGARVVTFGLDVSADVRATVRARGEAGQRVAFDVAGAPWFDTILAVPGPHMAVNAAAALAAVLALSSSNFRSLQQQSSEVFAQALAAFRGTWRRFERVGALNGAPVISDYAHHPTELRALAAAARQWYPDRRIVIAFQPHQRARTKAFGPAFVESLKLFDAIILAEVYDVAGREDPSDQTTSRAWVEPLQAAGKSVVFTPTLADVERAIRIEARSGDVILVVGAGDIYTVARRLASAQLGGVTPAHRPAASSLTNNPPS